MPKTRWAVEFVERSRPGGSSDGRRRMLRDRQRRRSAPWRRRCGLNVRGVQFNVVWLSRGHCCRRRARLLNQIIAVGKNRVVRSHLALLLSRKPARVIGASSLSFGISLLCLRVHLALERDVQLETL